MNSTLLMDISYTVLLLNSQVKIWSLIDIATVVFANTTLDFLILHVFIVLSLMLNALRDLIYKVLNLGFMSVVVVALWASKTDLNFIYVVYILAFVGAVIMLFLSVVLMLPSSAVAARSNFTFFAISSVDNFLGHFSMAAYILCICFLFYAVRFFYFKYRRPMDHLSAEIAPDSEFLIKHRFEHKYKDGRKKYKLNEEVFEVAFKRCPTVSQKYTKNFADKMLDSYAEGHYLFASSTLDVIGSKIPTFLDTSKESGNITESYLEAKVALHLKGGICDKGTSAQRVLKFGNTAKKQLVIVQSIPKAYAVGGDLRTTLASIWYKVLLIVRKTPVSIIVIKNPATCQQFIILPYANLLHPRFLGYKQFFVKNFKHSNEDDAVSRISIKKAIIGVLETSSACLDKIVFWFFKIWVKDKYGRRWMHFYYLRNKENGCMLYIIRLLTALDIIYQTQLQFFLFFSAIPTLGSFETSVNYVVFENSNPTSLDNLSAIQQALYVNMPIYMLVCVVTLLVALVGAATIHNKNRPIPKI